MSSRKGTELGKGLEHQERLRELSLEETLCSSLTGHPDGGWAVLPYKKGQDERTWPQALLRRFRLDIRMNLFPERVVKHWKGLSWEVVELPSLEVFKKQLLVP